jgi:hypothetical protein
LLCELMTTGWLLPGSLTVANCSSLYCWNAGPSSLTRLGFEMVRALMSVEGDVGQVTVLG